MINKMDLLPEGSDERVVMETLFQLASEQLMPTIGQTAGQNEDELKQSLIELWNHDLIRWMIHEDEDEDDGRFSLEMVQPDGTWKPIGIPEIH